MSVETIDPVLEGPRRPLQKGAGRGRRVAVWCVVGLAVLVAARLVAGDSGLTSSATWGGALRLTVPIAVVALGGLFSERSAIANVGLEGMMISGTWVAGFCGWHWGPWAALLGGVLGGLLLGIIMAVLCVELGLNQMIVGVALNVVAAAATRFLSEVVFAAAPGGSIAKSPTFSGGLPTVSVPLLAGGAGTPDAARWLEDTHWPVVTDLGGILGGLTRGVSLGTLIGLSFIPLTAYVLWKTKFGLRWRAVGEQPAALQALGGSVHRIRWTCLLVCSALAGFAGAYLTLIPLAYVQGQTGGRGFVGLATLIFGNWMPSGTFWGAALFGFSNAVGLGQPSTLRALVFALGLVFLIVGIIQWRRRGLRAGATACVLGGLLLAVFGWVPLPAEIASAAPYLVILAVLVVASRRMRPPAAMSQPFPRRR